MTADAADREGVMDLMAATELASVLNFVAFAMIAARHVAPWLRTLGRAAALIPLLCVGTFRDASMQSV